uniref:Uncharacterized protein n=1 Tax=Rhizophora mucronata TaxID=61149 RepID=A0A2P2J273_RHIMU
MSCCLTYDPHAFVLFGLTIYRNRKNIKKDLSKKI